MTRIEQPTAEAERQWNEWVASRPESVRAVAARFDPWSLYRLKTTDQRVYLISFAENGTVTVGVDGRFNLLVIERDVFGIDPDDLEPCEPPGPEELTGAPSRQMQDVLKQEYCADGAPSAESLRAAARDIAVRVNKSVAE